MAIKGYIIEKYNNMKNAYTCNRLVEEAEKLDIELRIIGVHDCCACSDGMYNNGEKLERRNFVLNRYKWGELKDELNGLAEKSYNALPVYQIYVNKYRQVSTLHSDAFLMPKYVLATAQYEYEQLVKQLGSPFVAKGLESSQGTEVSLIKSKEDYAELQKTYTAEKEFLFEEFISTSIGKDLRFYSIRGKVVAAMVRKSQGDFRANVALGASVEPYEITPEICQIAEDIYQQTGLDFLGIDLLFGEEKPYFCEINVMPGIEGMEKASGKNIARYIMETIKGDFEND